MSAPAALARRLGTGEAVVIGLGSMIGAGIFSAFSPAAEAAGSGLLIGLALAGAVAFCNAVAWPYVHLRGRHAWEPARARAALVDLALSWVVTDRKEPR